MVVGDQQTDKCQRDDVEKADSPEDLFDCCGEGFSRVGGFGGC